MTMGVADIDPNFPQERWPSHWEEIKQYGKMAIESVHKAKDEKEYPVEIILHNQQFFDKRYNCVFARDVTERLRSQNEIKENEELFRALFEQAGGYCMILEPTDSGIPNIFDANRAACEAHGYSREEMIGRPVADLDDEDGKRLCAERTEYIRFQVKRWQSKISMCEKMDQLFQSPSMLMWSTLIADRH